MKRIFTVIFTVATVLLLVLGFFMLTPTQTSADDGYKGKNKQKVMQKQKEHDKEHRKYRGEISRKDSSYYGKQNRRGYDRRQDYHKHRGYREHPYDHRIYVNYDFKGHRYDYDGHWRSWEQFDRYAKKHPNIYKYGGYYRQSSHLMFRFCEPDIGSCFYFSIGG
jgi:hypothetical protein